MPVAPNMLLLVSILENYEEVAYWEENDNTNDPYVGRTYQWRINLEIQPQFHGNHTTQTPYQFNGLDVQVGDWIASGVIGRALKIVEIESQDYSVATLIVEDYERYNTFNDLMGSGSGFIDTGNGIIFRLGSEGLPVLGPIPDLYMQDKAVEDLMARFIGRNNVTEFVLVRQENHGLFPGDVIYADFELDYGYKKVDKANLQRAIGIVTEMGVPGLAYFSYRPLGRLINNVNPPLWGAHGDVFYLNPDDPGQLTTDKPEENPIPVYLQLDLPNRAILLERGVEHGVKVKESETNKYDVENVDPGQTTFQLPSDVREVLYMTINGIENENYTFDLASKVLVFDPVETGYGVDVDDEVFFIYKS